MTGFRAWWVERRAARRALDAQLAAVDAELFALLDAADRGAR
jgi:hypothetical protein